MRLIGVMVCLLAAPWVQLSVSVDNGWPHNALQHHWLIPVSCHFRDCRSAASHESDSRKWRYNKWPYLYLHLHTVMLMTFSSNVNYPQYKTVNCLCEIPVCHCTQVSEVTQTDPDNLQFAKVCAFCFCYEL